MPVYNAAHYLDESVRSVLTQELAQLELICVDDASTDDSKKVIESLARSDGRVRLLCQPQNAGAPSARNRGLDAATGEYILFMDADDALCPGALGALVETARRTQAEAIKGLMLVSAGSGRPVPHGLNQSRVWTETTLRECGDIQHLYQYQSYLFDAKFLRATNVRFEQALRNFQDPVFLAHLLPQSGHIEVTDIPVYLRKTRPGSIITSTWQLENYESLIAGVAMAYGYLMDHGQRGAAGKIALTFSNWWYKFEAMPANLNREQCVTLFASMRDFILASEHPVTSDRWNKVEAKHCLTMIAEDKLEECYVKLYRRSKVRRLGMSPVLKLGDFVVHMITDKTWPWSSGRNRYG